MKNKATLYIIQGFIGAGKSTFSRELACKTNAIHLNPDKSISTFFKEDEYMNNWNECFDKTVQKLWEIAKDNLKSGNDVIFDMGFWLKKDRMYAKQIAKDCNVNFIHYYLNVPDEILKERIVKTRPPKWAKLHLENFESNKLRFECPEKDENPIIINNY